MESHGDGETISLEMPKNETAKVHLGTVWESGVTGLSGGDSSASAGIDWEGAPEVRGIIPACPHLLEPHTTELDLPLLFQVLLFPSCLHPALTPSDPVFAIQPRDLPTPRGSCAAGHLARGLRAWWFHLHTSETDSEPCPS